MIEEYDFSPMELLAKPELRTTINRQKLRDTAAKLQKMLEDFGVRAFVVNINCSPFITQYEIQLEQGVRIRQITKLSDDIKLNLAVSDIQIDAPIPDKSTIGINIPNEEYSTVFIREVIESRAFAESISNVVVALGKDMLGNVVVGDIAMMSNLLIEGTISSGKTTLINSIIMSIIYKSLPRDTRMIIIDTKKVDLSVYNGIPHLLIPVITDLKKANEALKWAVMEMIDRYKKFADLGAKDFKEYNKKVYNFDNLNSEYLIFPQIVIIIDDLADLMLSSYRKEIEGSIYLLTQKANVTGLYLIISTQRPSTDIITGRIKANIRSRVAFNTFSAIDSRTILEEKGAEKLLGNGDMLFKQKGFLNLIHVQGAFVSDYEISRVVDFLKKQYIRSNFVNEETPIINDRDDYFFDAGRFIIEKEKASIGMLQRVYKIGFNRAAQIMDQLETAGVVGSEEGTKPRKILMTMKEFESKYLE